uniref:Ig-like domain-containing protein n=1 Tax=Chrysemys picta bellii TaxID=8478 RepID=A0A8C3HNK6_CHRPI
MVHCGIAPGGQYHRIAATLSLIQTISCCEAQVDQSPEWLVTGEGKVSIMSCSFTSTYRTFQWYQQLPGQGPTHLLTASSNENVTLGRFTGERLESGKRSSLHITDSQLGDSGSYLCAVDAQ